MKRSIGERDHHLLEFDNISMANCLMLLSRGADHDLSSDGQSPNRVFECKTCNRQFPSFQALGGHRASHKKPRLNPSSSGDGEAAALPTSPPNPKTHECSICGLEFAIGQALGGHMRRHRVVAGVTDHHQYQSHTTVAPKTLNLLPVSAPVPLSNNLQVAAPMVKRSNGRSILSLDLNLTPFENDVELFRIDKVAPVIHCYL